ncbi:MAG TPA: DUF3037 domain-containing protein [Terriglobales bacterium]|jgi:hypothetical protein|nr:DUF3037 domain-containing protein [Terriglobales bacterium]
MADLKQCEFFLLRYVPDAVKDEFVNIGVMLVEPGANGAGFAEVKFTRDWQRVKCLDPAADVEMLAVLEDDLRTRLKEGGREDFLRSVEESFSNVLQLSPAKACLTESPAEELGRLAEMYLERVRRPAGKGTAAGRQLIAQRMREAFEQAGVWKLMRKRVAVAQYTHPGDPLKIDCGYRPNGEVKLFHAVSLATDVDAAKVLAFTYPQIREGIARLEQAKTSLTAIVEDDLDRGDEPIAFALDTLARSQIAVAAQAELPRLAEAVRRDLRV